MTTTFRLLENRPGVTYNVGDNKTLYAEDIQAICEAINFLETKLGADFWSSFTNLATRLSNIESRLGALE